MFGSYSPENWNNLVLECRDQIVGDPYLQGVNAFRRMVKTYTNNIVYTNIGKKMRTSQFEDIQSYCTTLIEGLNAHGPERKYQAYHKPVYRGVSAEFIKETDYIQGSIGFWPTFSSTSTDANIGYGFARQAARRLGADAIPVVFEIYISSKNNFPTNIHTAIENEEWSYWPNEQEVLLFPFFAFQVVKVVIKKEIKHIVLIELPYQNLMKIREISACSLIFCTEEAEGSKAAQTIAGIEQACPLVKYVHCPDMKSAHLAIQ